MTRGHKIGSCDCCDRQNVPLSHFVDDYSDEWVCFICQGEDEVDPYGELEGSPAWRRDNGRDGVGA